MTTNGKCFLCGTPLATPEQIYRHICDACNATAKNNAALMHKNDGMVYTFSPYGCGGKGRTDEQ